MLERLSTSQDSSMHKHARAKSERFHVFGSKKQASFHIVITELRAELMNAKQVTSGHPCVLQWVRGDTVHVTDESVGQTVLSWSDTYFAQVVAFQMSSASNFRPKECKFKVQQKGKTIAKTALVDLSKYCSEVGLAREQAVTLPLQPVGTLYFVISTSPASERQQQDGSQRQLRPQGLPQQAPSESLNSSWQEATASQSGPLASTATTAAPRAGPTTSAAAATGGASGSSSSNTNNNHNNSNALQHGSVASSGHADGHPTSIASTRVSKEVVLTALPITPVSSAKAGSSGSSVLERYSNAPHELGDRPSSSGLAVVATRKQGTGSGTGSTAAGTTDVEPASGNGSASIFRRIVRGGGGGGGGKVTPASLSAGASPQQHVSHYRQSESAAVKGARRPLHTDPKVERATSMAVVPSHGGGDGDAQASVSELVVRSASCTPGAACNSASAMQRKFPSTGDTVKMKRAASAGASNSNSSRSDTGTSIAAVVAGKGAAAGTAAEAGGAGDAGGKGRWGTWLRNGLGWGRGSNHSAGTGTSTTGALSNASPTGTGAAVGAVLSAAAMGMGAAAPATAPAAPEPDSSALEAAIMSAIEPAELRDFALDLLHERDEWRSRALSLQEALTRAQATRGPAVREVQRLELRVRQYQDELGRQKDGTLLQELVDAKIRIAELCNENMKMRRQIMHMGPMFYDDSGDDAAAAVDTRDT